MNPMMPTSLDELQMAIANGTFPGMAKPAAVLPFQGIQPLVPKPGAWPQAPSPMLTEESVRAIIAEEFEKRGTAPTVQFQKIIAAADVLFKKALPQEDFAAFAAYMQSGSPSFNDMLESGKFDPLAQLLWETIKENTP